MDEKKVREAIEILKGIEEVRGNLLEDGNEIEEAFIVIIEALEKQLPKKGIKEKITDGTNKGLHKFYCPICYGNGDLRNKCNVGQYCSDCGQKLDWTVEE